MLFPAGSVENLIELVLAHVNRLTASGVAKMIPGIYRTTFCDEQPIKMGYN